MPRYIVATNATISSILGTQCSPIGPCRCTGAQPGYVLGPDINGVLSHLATCRTIGEAYNLASEWNLS